MKEKIELNSEAIMLRRRLAAILRLQKKDIISDGKYEELLLDAFRPNIVYNLNAAEVERYD